MVFRLSLVRASQTRSKSHPDSGERPVVVENRRRRLAQTGRAGLGHRSQDGPSGDTRLLERRAGILPLGGKASAHRGRVGDGGARRAGRQTLRLGRRPYTGRQAYVQYMAGRLSQRQHRRGRIRRRRSRQVVRPQRLWHLQRQRQCVGMAVRLVQPPAFTAPRPPQTPLARQPA